MTDPGASGAKAVAALVATPAANIINLPHELFSPLCLGTAGKSADGQADGCISSDHRRCAVQAGENRGHNGQHSFAAFVHLDIIAISLFVRILKRESAILVMIFIDINKINVVKFVVVIWRIYANPTR